MNTPSKISTVFLLVIAIVFAGCGGGGSQTGSTEAAEAPEASEPAATEDVPEVAEIVIEGNDLMQFDLNNIEVIEGQKVKLTLKHVGSMSVEVMGHNWVLLKPGTDIATFGMAAVAEKENDYIPQDLAESVIAFTEVIGGGEEVTIEFEAPSIGYYKFICSFPGHYGVMQGDFVVSPK